MALQGSLSRLLAALRTKAGNLTFTGALSRALTAARTKAGDLTFSGTVEGVKGFAKSTAGSLTAIGALVRSLIAARKKDGNLTFTGTVARKLTAGEVLVLNTTYRLAKQELSFTGRSGIINADRWLCEIAKHSGFTHKELVEMHEAELIKKHLLTDRKRNDRSEAYLGPTKSRLTSLGQGISEYIDHYNELEDELETESS